MPRVPKRFRRLTPLLILIPCVVIALFFIGMIVLRENGFLPPAHIFPKGVRYVASQMIVQYKEGQSPEELQKAGKTQEVSDLTTRLSALGVLSQKKIFTSENSFLTNYYLLTLQKGISIPALYERLQTVPEIETATPDYVLKIQDTPNDPYFPQMWNLQNIGISSAWNTIHTNKKVTVGVVDTGVDYNHEDLQGVVIKGRNFIDNNNDPMDDQGHGTHVAGILGAVTNNGVGVSGVSWGAKILAVKVCDAQGDCDTSNVARGITYAVDNGAKIINVSIAGTGSCSGTYNSVLSYAARKGVLVVTAAGNGNNGDGVGVDAASQIPAGCNNILAVGALTSQNTRSSFSNYGSHVKISAPGGQGPCAIPSCILSTSPNNGYTLRAGTSMAAPQVSGAAALLLAKKSNLSVSKVTNCLINSADSVQTDHPMGGLLNPTRALTLCSSNNVVPTPTPPNVIIGSSSSISGTVFVDTNNDGIFEKPEKVFPGAQVILSGLLSDSVISNSSGHYVFSSLDPGLYTITRTVSGQNVGYPINVTIVSTNTHIQLDLPVPPSAISNPVPTSPSQTSGQCYLNPACLKGNKAVQVCSFQCTP